MTKLDDGFVTATVAAVDHDTSDSAVITFADDDTIASFRHGQHLTLRRWFDDTEVRRSYSICSASPDGPLRVAIRRVDGGVMSTWATTELSAGDHVDVLPPSGNFTHDLDPSTSRRYTLFAAGSGITPMYSIAATVLANEPNARVTLVYLNRTSQSSMLLDEVHQLRDRYLDRFAVTFAFTREETSGELLTGRPDQARVERWIDTGILPVTTDHAFLCGPIDLVNTVEAALVDAGMPADRVHREIFTTNQVGIASSGPAPVSEHAVAVARGKATLHGRTTEFEMYEGDSVLDAVQRERPDAPFSCRSGVCSTCQAVIRSGQVEMAINYGLTADEVARGYVLTCQSRPTTDTVVVDYDG